MLHSPLAVLRPIGPRVPHRIEPRRAIAATAIVIGGLVGSLLPTTAGAEPARLHGPAPDPASAAAVVEPRIELAVGVVPSMAVGGLGCEEAVAAGLTPVAGQGTSTFCFTVTNAGEVAVDEITITDARAGLVGAVLPQVGGTSPLDPGEQAVFYHHAVPVPAPSGHRPEASARAVGVPPNDTDWSVGGVVSTDAEPPEALAMTGPTLAQPWLLAALATGLIFFGYTAIAAVRRPIGDAVGDPTDPSAPTDPVGGRSLLDVYGGDEVDARVVLEAEEAAVRAQEEAEPEPIGRRRADDGPEPAVVFGGDPAPTPIEPVVSCQPAAEPATVVEPTGDCGPETPDEAAEPVDDRDLDGSDETVDAVEPVEAVESTQDPDSEVVVERPTPAASPVVVVLSVATTATCPLPTPVGWPIHGPITSRRWAIAGPDTRILTGQSTTRAVTSPFTGPRETLVEIRPRPTETVVELRPARPADPAPAAATSSDEAAAPAEAYSGAGPVGPVVGELGDARPDGVSDEQTEVDRPVPGLRPEVATRWRPDEAPESEPVPDPEPDPEPLPRLTAVPSLDDGWSSPVPELPRWSRAPTPGPARRPGRPLPAALVPVANGSDAPIPVSADGERWRDRDDRDDRDDLGERRPELTLVPAADDTVDQAGHAQLDAFGFD